MAVVSASVGAAGARSGGFAVFLWRLTIPLGIGFLIIVITEILRAMNSAPRENGEDPSAGVAE